MLDLSFGLPLVVRDAALKMVAPGPESAINREFYAQEHEKEIAEGRGGVEAYAKTDEKARELLRRLAQSEPYYKRQRRLEASGENTDEAKALSASTSTAAGTRPMPGPVRSRGGRGGMRGGGAVRGKGRPVFPGTAQLPPGPQDILPPSDPNITSLFVTGVEDDLPEHELRKFFSKFGTLRSLVCSHRAHCAFINYVSRQTAETAAESCQGRAVIQGCPLRVQWGKPKALDTMDRDERIALAKEGRETMKAIKANSTATPGAQTGQYAKKARDEELDRMSDLPPPPGSGDVQYASLAGN